MSFNYSEPIMIDWITDGDGNKVSLPVNNEQKQVVSGRITLDYLPDSFYRVTAVSAPLNSEIEIDEQILSTAQYKVDYNTGCIFIHPDLEGDTLTFNYYKKGVIKYPASRIYTQRNGGYITETVQDNLEELYNEFDNVDDKLDEFNDTLNAFSNTLDDELNIFDNKLNIILNETNISPNKDPEVTNARDSSAYGAFNTVKVRLDNADERLKMVENGIGRDIDGGGAEDVTDVPVINGGNAVG